MEIQRYRICAAGCENCDAETWEEKDSCGEWVRYSDVERLQAQIAELQKDANSWRQISEWLDRYGKVTLEKRGELVENIAMTAYGFEY